MKVLLVFAGISESGFNTTEKPLKLVWLNHGLASIASSVRRAGHEVDLIDLRQLSSWDEFKSKLIDSRAEVVGITMMSVDYIPACKTARIAKEALPDSYVVVGGPHPSLVLPEVEAEKAFDFIIQGEGEISFVKLLEEIKSGRAAHRAMRGIVPDLDTLPFADRQIFRAGEMPIVSFLRTPFVTIIAGRGCKYNCSFCQPAERHIFGSTVRRRSVDNVIEELKLLRERLRFQSMMIHDDCLTEDRPWVMEFCEKYRRNGFRQPFVCQSRADIICKNKDMVRLMARAGLSMFLIGFESGNQRVLNLLRKGTTVEQNYEANRICRRYGIRVWANYMLGIPTETNVEALDTLKMIKRIKPYVASPAFYTPHPGSDLYDMCIKDGLSLVNDHGDYARSSFKPKIAGIDYEFLKGVLEESRKVPLSVKLHRKIDRLYERKIKKYVNKTLAKIASSS